MDQESKMQDSNNKKKNLLSSFRDLVIITSVCLYFVGWIFIRSYFDDFGVGLFSLDIPFYYFFIYSAYAFSHAIFVWWILLVTLVVIGGIVTVTKKSKWSEWVKKHSTTFSVLTAIFIFVFLYLIATTTGKICAEANRKRENYPTVTFTFKRDTALSLPYRFVDANENQSLKLLVQTRDRIYVYLQTEFSKGKPPILYELNKEDIYLTIIEQKADLVKIE